MMYKKGEGEWDTMLKVIFFVLLLGLGIWAIWEYGVNKTGKNVASVQTCNAIGVGQGTCRSECIDTELSFEDMGCEGEENICCISKEPKADTGIVTS